jgi:hypothetical protein
MFVVYGLPGTGKSEAIINEINRRKANGEFIFYAHLRNYCRSMNKDSENEN